MRAVVSPEGYFQMGSRVYRVALGRGGVRIDKREGDGATPAGLLALRRVLFRADRIGKPPSCALLREPISPDDGWCDDPLHPDYNRMVRLPHPARCEALWRPDPLYDVVGVLGWNDAPPVPGRGSAIFLHVATPDLSPTAGCIALALADLLAVLAAGLTEIEVSAG
jgi:L,D-peptidoglycan transpeptidase YkuD (ErfK/YbiS/YcfS/YnhG family)